MTETLDITDLPEYGQAMREFQIAKGQAEAAGDQLAVLQAESTYNKTLSTLKDRKFEALQAQRALETSRAAVAAKFPKVDPELYAHIQDPAAIEAYATRIQAGVDAAVGAQPPPQGTPPEGGTWGGSPPSSGTGVPTTPEKTPEERIRELAPVVVEKGRNAMAENREMRQLAVAPIIDKVLSNASKNAGFNVETGGPLE